MTDQQSQGQDQPQIQQDEPPLPKTFKDFIMGIFWRDIRVRDGGKELRINMLMLILLIAVLVVSLVILERTGVIDDFVRAKKTSHNENGR